MPLWFHRNVRPLLERLGLLVALLGLLRCPEIVEELLRPGCHPPWKTTRATFSDLLTVLECHTIADPAALDAPISGVQPFSQWMSSRACSARRKIDDGWGRPIMVRRLSTPWLLELRSAGPDAQFDTFDDKYAWVNADLRAAHEEELRRATLTATVRRAAAAWSGDDRTCHVQATLRDRADSPSLTDIPCDALLALPPA